MAAATLHTTRQRATASWQTTRWRLRRVTCHEQARRRWGRHQLGVRKKGVRQPWWCQVGKGCVTWSALPRPVTWRRDARRRLHLTCRMPPVATTTRHQCRCCRWEGWAPSWLLLQLLRRRRRPRLQLAQQERRTLPRRLPRRWGPEGAVRAVASTVHAAQAVSAAVAVARLPTLVATVRYAYTATMAPARAARAVLGAARQVPVSAAAAATAPCHLPTPSWSSATPTAPTRRRRRRSATPRTTTHRSRSSSRLRHW